MAVQPTEKPWTSGLCGCFSDCGICCYGFWCLPCLYGDNYAKNNNGSGCCAHCLLYSCFPLCACCFAGPNRRNLRFKYNLAAEPCSDCCVHCCYWTSACGVCQEARELKHQAQAPIGAYTAAPVAAPPPAQVMSG